MIVSTRCCKLCASLHGRYMGIGPAITQHAQEAHGFSAINAKAIGAVVGGVISASLSHPLDTIKVKMTYLPSTASTQYVMPLVKQL